MRRPDMPRRPNAGQGSSILIVIIVVGLLALFGLVHDIDAADEAKNREDGAAARRAAAHAAEWPLILKEDK